MPQQVQRLNYLSVILYHLTGGRAYRGSPGVDGPRRPARAGQPRTVHLLYIRDGSAYVVTASNGGKQRPPGWFFNVSSHPQVSMHVHGTQVSAVAEVAEPDKRRELWARLLSIAPMYAGYEKQTTRDIPMVILRPVNEQPH